MRFLIFPDTLKAVNGTRIRSDQDNGKHDQQGQIQNPTQAEGGGGQRGEQVETTARRKIEELELPQLKLAGREELSARLDKARTSFDTLREALSLKSA
jgi:hypothetical protein